MAKITKSVVLSPNEKFTLPPNSTLIATSSLANTTSTCDLPDNTEELACFVALFSTASIAQVGSDTIYWGPNQARIAGFVIDDVKTYFGTAYTNSGSNLEFTSGVMTAMGTELKTNIPGIVNTSSSFVLSQGNDNGTLSYFLIQTLPSIASRLKMLYSSSVPSNSDNFGIELQSPFYTYAEITGGGYTGYPSCTMSDVNSEV